MPFPVDEKYISNTESELCVEFRKEFKERMMETNGGELVLKNYQFDLYTFFDKTDKKRISRTCNHIGLETKNARQWNGFPANGVAIGSDGFGNQLILIHNGNSILSEKLFFWNHETGTFLQISETINTKEKEQRSLWKRITSKLTN